MATFSESVAGAVRGALCAAIALNDDGARLFGRVPGLKSGADYFNFFAPLRAQLCDDDPAEVPTPAPPFTGGQCPSTPYTITWTNLTPGLPPRNFSGQLNGPLSLSRALEPGDDSSGCAPGQSFNRIRMLGSSGGLNLGSGCGVTVSNIQVEPLFGLPDDCGDPDVDVPPPGPVTRPIDVTYNTEEGDEVTITGDVTFAPSFSTGDLNVRVPVFLDLGGLNWFGDLEITPRVNLTIAPRINFGNSNPVDDPTVLVDPSPEDTEPTPPPENEPVIIGVVVRGTRVGAQKASSIAVDGIPTIYAPRVGNVSFAIQTGVVTSWTADIPVKNLDSYIPCPAPQGAVGVGVDPEPGFNLTFTAVRGRPLLDLTT